MEKQLDLTINIPVENDSNGKRERMEFEKGDSLMDMGSGDFGCLHYRRRCKIRAPCCGDVFDCRHCHNEAKNALEVNQIARHEIPRHQVTKVICSLCNKEQDVQQNCINCGVNMGTYFCSKCKFFDDDVSKNTYHCDGCGICRVGGTENFFHCSQCGCCYSKMLKGSHQCVERAMHHNCPICFEYLFDSVRDVSVLQCGHTIHLACLKEMKLHFQFSCPVCSRSMCDMSGVWEKLDQEVAATSMPEIYQNKMVWILCNDCGSKSNVNFHIVAHKCQNCNSYNTKQTMPVPCSSRI
ncbi:hypothetical protein J5N97_023567 [Dioscorea zingiberensis]|uniref:Uncharacterized protein n=1 Tax=Dioscorea zingiberensis TaxID=325984 RepID=A0A9D5C533_9LILI|nr:hypothetical protein J5N97_023567 [Dioscorea zingiberensis]